MALVWGSLSPLEKFSSPAQQVAPGAPMSVCFGPVPVRKRGRLAPQFLGKPSEAQGLWSAGVPGIALSGRKEAQSVSVYLPYIPKRGSPSQWQPLLWAGWLDEEHICLLCSRLPSVQPHAWQHSKHSGSAEQMNEWVAFEVLPFWAFALRDSFPGPPGTGASPFSVSLALGHNQPGQLSRD